MKNKNHLWIIESKICQKYYNTKWKPCLGFGFGSNSISGVYLSRKLARKAVKKMFKENQYNYRGANFEPYVFYRANKYIG